MAVEGRHRVRLWLAGAKHNLSDYFLLTEFHVGTDQLEPAKYIFWIYIWLLFAIYGFSEY